MTEQTHNNYGIIFGGDAAVTDSALAAGSNARAVHHGGSTKDLEAVRELLGEFRSLLAQQAVAGGITPDQHSATDHAVRAVADELDTARPGRLQVLATRISELTACVAGIGGLAEVAGRLQSAVQSITG